MPRAVERCLVLPLFLGYCQITVEWPQDSDDREDVSNPGASDLVRSLSSMSTGHTLTEVQ